ncbi:MAG: carboxypeptidase PM20D1 [Candidatus Azotimanducaceae bacterium]|jgi:carboxypeptidase PM20D1
MKRTFFVLLSIIGIVVTVVLIRTVLHLPENVEMVAPVQIEIDENAIAQNLSEAIQFPTISNQNPKLKDQAAFENFISWVGVTYPETDRVLTRERYVDSLLYFWEGKNKDLQPILITGHYDVVPVIPGTENLWEHPPFAGEISDGIIWGRGALDDKSGVIGMIEAVEHLIKEGFQPERGLYLSFGHDEEIGGVQGAGSVVAALQEKGVQLAWSLDEGSFVMDGMFPGIGFPMAPVNVAEKGSLTLEIVAKAAGGHSSAPPKQTAVGILAEAITKLEQHPVPGGLEGLSLQMFDVLSRYMPFSQRVFFANLWLFDGLLDEQLSKEGLTNAMLRTTTAPTMLSASIKSNVLPIEAVAVVNFRIHPRDSVDGVLAFVKNIVESDSVEVRYKAGYGREASIVSSWDADGFKIISDATKEIYTGTIVTPGLMIAASDTRHYGKIADNAYRFNPFILTPKDFTGFHGTNEQISVKSMANGVRAYIQIIKHGTAK